MNLFLFFLLLFSINNSFSQPEKVKEILNNFKTIELDMANNDTWSSSFDQAFSGFLVDLDKALAKSSIGQRIVLINFLYEDYLKTPREDGLEIFGWTEKNAEKFLKVFFKNLKLTGPDQLRQVVGIMSQFENTQSRLILKLPWLLLFKNNGQLWSTDMPYIKNLLTKKKQLALLYYTILLMKPDMDKQFFLYDYMNTFLYPNEMNIGDLYSAVKQNEAVLNKIKGKALISVGTERSILDCVTFDCQALIVVDIDPGVVLFHKINSQLVNSSENRLEYLKARISETESYSELTKAQQNAVTKDDFFWFQLMREVYAPQFKSFENNEFIFDGNYLKYDQAFDHYKSIINKGNVFYLQGNIGSVESVKLINPWLKSINMTVAAIDFSNAPINELNESLILLALYKYQLAQPGEFLVINTGYSAQKKKSIHSNDVFNWAYNLSFWREENELDGTPVWNKNFRIDMNIQSIGDEVRLRNFYVKVKPDCRDVLALVEP